MTAQAPENTKQPKKANEVTEQTQEKLTCGIIMPIATMNPEYTSEHWEDVRAIIDTAIRRAGFEPRIVSDSEDSTIIHKSIINNIYNDEIIVCDVSNKNANVMFELGMRLAFNKPVVIIKDDLTGYSFDTSNIEHIGYRKDLRHNTVEKFINELARKIRATHEAPKKEDYQPFLSHFGKFEVATIENKSIGESEALEGILNKINSIENQFNKMLSSTPIPPPPPVFPGFNFKNSNKTRNSSIYVKSGPLDPNQLSVITDKIFKNISNVIDVRYDHGDHSIEVILSDSINVLDVAKLEDIVKAIIDHYSDN